MNATLGSQHKRSHYCNICRTVATNCYTNITFKAALMSFDPRGEGKRTRVLSEMTGKMARQARLQRQSELEREPLFGCYNGLLSLLCPGNNIRSSSPWHQATARAASREAQHIIRLSILSFLKLDHGRRSAPKRCTH